MGASNEKELENERNPPGMSAPPWTGASVTHQEPWPADWLRGDAQPRDAGIDRSKVTPFEGDAAATSPPLQLELFEDAVMSPPPKRDRFGGDMDIMELRRRLSIDPQCIPEPPFRAQRPSAIQPSSVYVGTALVFACGVIAATLSYAQRTISSHPGDAVAVMTAESTTGRRAAEPMIPALLVIRDRRAFMNEPLALGAVLLEGAGGEAIHVTGLTAGTRLSAGEPLASTGWRIPGHDLAGVLVFPPLSFVGIMNAAIQLRSGDNAPVDTQFARFEWIPKSADGRTPGKPELDRSSPQPAPIAERRDRQRTSWFVSRGVELINLGDFAAARLVLRPAAEAGDPQAALMLGATFDPVVVAELGALGLAPDPSVARVWYQRAMESGSSEASGRIERLARMSK